MNARHRRARPSAIHVRPGPLSRGGPNASSPRLKLKAVRLRRDDDSSVGRVASARPSRQRGRMCEAMLQAKQISDGEVPAKLTSKVSAMLTRRPQPDTFAAQATATRGRCSWESPTARHGAGALHHQRPRRPVYALPVARHVPVDGMRQLRTIIAIPPCHAPEIPIMAREKKLLAWSMPWRGPKRSLWRIVIEYFGRLMVISERYHRTLSDFIGYGRSTILNESIHCHINLNELGDR